MSLSQALFLGILQGITEFLPVSSSGHLVMAEHLLGLPVNNLLSFDVILHAGTLLALVIYFWKELSAMLIVSCRDLKHVVLGKSHAPDEHFSCPHHLLKFLVIATLPVVLFAPFLKNILEQYFRSPDMVVALLLVTAFFLASAELFGSQEKKVMRSYFVALLMGFFQLLAILPGISRSGSTIVGGLLGGLTRETAARFAFLMAIPAIFGATIYMLKDFQIMMAEQISLLVLLTGFSSSAVASLLVVMAMMKFVRSRSLWWFVVYLVAVNIVWFVIY